MGGGESGEGRGMVAREEKMYSREGSLLMSILGIEGYEMRLQGVEDQRWKERVGG